MQKDEKGKASFPAASGQPGSWPCLTPRFSEGTAFFHSPFRVLRVVRGSSSSYPFRFFSVLSVPSVDHSLLRAAVARPHTRCKLHYAGRRCDVKRIFGVQRNGDVRAVGDFRRVDVGCGSS